MKVYLAELGDQKIQAVGLVELCDMLLKAEVLDDVFCAAGKVFYVVRQILCDVIRVALELFKCKAAGVVK